jgi:peroxiredoxin
MKKLILFFTAALFISGFTLAKEPYKAGDLATDFNLKNLNGKNISLSQFEDAKGFIVVFTCNTCPVVKQYEQRIVDLHDKFAAKGYPVVAINSNDRNVSPGDSYEEMQKLARSKGYKFEYLYDESQEIAKEYGATNTPHVYVLSKQDGDDLRIEYVGAIDNNADDASKADKHYVQDAVNALLKGDQVPVAGTKAVGCGIKWKKT